MNINLVEIATANIQKQHYYYADLMELPVKLTNDKLEVTAGATTLVFKQADSDFDGAYHFAFNISENQHRAAKEWLSGKIEVLYDENGLDEFDFSNWNAHSIYFKDAAGNVLEFIARHNLNNSVRGNFDSTQILQVSEIGLPSENVMAFANDLCARLNLSVFRQEPNENFTPVGDDDGLFILPIKDRIWFPNSGVPAKLLPVKVNGSANGKEWKVRGYPYEIL